MKKVKLKLTDFECNVLINGMNEFRNSLIAKGIPSLDTFIVICDALKITPDYVILGTIRKAPQDNFIDIVKLCNEWESSILLDFANVLISNRKK